MDVITNDPPNDIIIIVNRSTTTVAPSQAASAPDNGNANKGSPRNNGDVGQNGDNSEDAHKRPCQLNKILVVDWRRVTISVGCSCQGGDVVTVVRHPATG